MYSDYNITTMHMLETYKQKKTITYLTNIYKLN